MGGYAKRTYVSYPSTKRIYVLSTNVAHLVNVTNSTSNIKVQETPCFDRLQYPHLDEDTHTHTHTKLCLIGGRLLTKGCLTSDQVSGSVFGKALGSNAVLGTPPLMSLRGL